MHSLSVQVLSSEGLGTSHFFLPYSEGGFPFHLTVHPSQFPLGLTSYAPIPLNYYSFLTQKFLILM